MTGPARRASRPALAVVSLALVALASAQAPVASQSPSVPAPSTAPGASSVPIASATPIDVGSIRWKQSKKSKGFGPRDGSPLAFDLAVGPTGRFLLVGVNEDRTPSRRAVIFGSDDGVRWTKLKGSIPKGSSAAAVLATDDGFLIAGDVDGAAPLLLTSDGTRVSKLDAPAEGLPTGPLYGLAQAPAGLVALGNDANGAPTAWLSADGLSWTATALPDAFYAIHVAVTDDGTIVALGNQQDANMVRTPTAWSSTDGTTWTTTPLPVEPGEWSVPDLERTPLGLVATIVGSGEGVALLSTDGTTWTRSLEASGALLVGSAGDEAMVFGTDTWWHSADGVTWTEAEAPQFGGYRIETSAIRPDGAVIAGGYLFSGFTAMDPTDSVRTWVGAPPAP